MATRVLVLGAGFGGLELSTMLSEALGDDVDVTLIDKNDAFVFGFAKLDVMFGRKSAAGVRHHYGDISKTGVRFLQETITAIDPQERRVTTDAGVHEADVMVVALGADYDFDATPFLAERGNEFYSVAGAIELAGIIPSFSSGHAVIGVCGAPFKCPPAPSECALLLHEELLARGVRDQCEISVVIPFGTPVPPSPETSAALVEAFVERDITFVPGRRVIALDSERPVAVLDDGSEMPFDLFLGVPKHRAPDVVIASGMTQDGYVTVNPQTLETPFPDVYAVGDVATIGVPKAGVFAEGAARVVAQSLIARPGRRRRAGSLRGHRLLLHRVRRGSRRPRRRRLHVGPVPDGDVQRAVRRTRRREAGLRLQPRRALVRVLSTRSSALPPRSSTSRSLFASLRAVDHDHRERRTHEHPHPRTSRHRGRCQRPAARRPAARRAEDRCDRERRLRHRLPRRRRPALRPARPAVRLPARGRRVQRRSTPPTRGSPRRVRASRRTAAVTIAIGNLVWMVASIALVIAGWHSPTTTGSVWIVMQGLLVAAFADAQLLGVRRAGGR